MPGLDINIYQGLKKLASGGLALLRADRTSALVTTDAHGRFQEAALSGNLYGGGMTLTSISNATFTTATLGATCTPIVGIWNPSTSGKNAVILQAKLQTIITALQVTGQGAYMWCTSTGNGALTLGTTPFNRTTLSSSGSVVKDMSGIALTGLTNNLVVREASSLQGGPGSNLSTLQTAAGLMPLNNPAVENIDGAYIVPPGGILALLCTTNPPVAISAASGIMWEELDI